MTGPEHCQAAEDLLYLAVCCDADAEAEDGATTAAAWARQRAQGARQAAQVHATLAVAMQLRMLAEVGKQSGVTGR